MSQTNSNIKERIKLKEPRRYQVIFFNDDVTTMDFVIEVLTTVFHKAYQEAEELMMKVHLNGSAVVGVYSYDIALTKTTNASEMAYKAGFPLRIEMQAE